MAGAAPTHNGEKRTATACCGLDWRDRHLLLQPCAAVAAAGAVDLDHAFVPFVRKLGAGDGDGAAGDLQHVAGPGVHAPQIGWRQPRNGVADVLDTRFRNAQREPFPAWNGPRCETGRSTSMSFPSQSIRSSLVQSSPVQSSAV